VEITIIRQGGFRGVHERLGPVDTSSLGGKGAEIEAKVEAIGFFSMPERLPGGDGPDRFWYRFNVVDSDRSHTVAYSDGSDGAQLPSLKELEDLLIDAGAGFESIPRAGEGLVATDRCFEWSAWYNRMGGREDPELHVSGTCELHSGSGSAVLEPTNVGVAPEPDLVALRLTIEYPPVGTDDVVEREVSWSEDVGPDVKRVRIVGDAETELEVTIAT
jgi:hypothetical protein